MRQGAAGFNLTVSNVEGLSQRPTVGGAPMERVVVFGFLVTAALGMRMRSFDRERARTTAIS